VSLEFFPDSCIFSRNPGREEVIEMGKDKSPKKEKKKPKQPKKK
jgi:hypothetical protein